MTHAVATTIIIGRSEKFFRQLDIDKVGSLCMRVLKERVGKKADSACNQIQDSWL